MKIQIDAGVCQGHGRCYEVALEVWLQRIPTFTLADPTDVRWSAGQVRGPRALALRIGG
jgi:hypothetical protein